MSGDGRGGSPDLTSPQVSVVVTTRNDDHGGDPLARLRAHLRFLARAAAVARISVEEVIVEWNPPADRPPIAAELPVHELENDFLSIRVVTVDRDEHARLPNSDRLPLFQMIAKNVGIRTSRAPLVLTTNIDVLIGSAVLRRVAATRPGEVVTATRVDVDGWSSLDLATVSDSGAELWQNVAAVNAPLGMAIAPPRLVRRMLTRRPGTRGARMLDSFGLAAAVLGRQLLLDPIKALAQIINRTRKEPDLEGVPTAGRRRAGLLGLFARTNACGDFLLLHRDDWADLGGFPEWPIYSWHLDSVLLFQATLSGRRPRHLRLPLCVWHLNHDIGSGFSPSQPTALHDRLVTDGIPAIDDRTLRAIRHGLALGPTGRLNLDNPTMARDG